MVGLQILSIYSTECYYDGLLWKMKLYIEVVFKFQVSAPYKVFQQEHTTSEINTILQMYFCHWKMSLNLV